jgi:hypothetical protein
MRSIIVIRLTGPQVTAKSLGQRSVSPKFTQPSSTSTVSLSTASLSTSTTKSDAMHERLPLTVCEEQPLHKSKALDRAFRSTNFFALLLVLVLSPPRRTVLVLVLDALYYSNTTYRSASYREEPRSTIGIAAVQTAIEPRRHLHEDLWRALVQASVQSNSLGGAVPKPPGFIALRPKVSGRCRARGPHFV